MAVADTFTVALLITCSLACASGGPTSPGQRPTPVPTGTWGGPHVGMEVTAAGAQLEFDCAHGRITERLVIDAAGNFDVRGTYTLERPGPRRDDDAPTPTPVRYSGKVNGRTMVLTIANDGNTSDVASSFTLEHERPPVIRKCL